MTTTDEILALAAEVAGAAPQAGGPAGDLARFAEAVTRGMDSPAVSALRALRPGRAPGPVAAAALPGGPAWDAWVSATAATSAGPPGATSRFVVCAAATALGQDCTAAVAVGVRAAALVESRLDTSAGWSAHTVSAVVGAGLAAGLMLALPAPELRNTLGICATQAAGLDAAAGTGAAPLQAGKAAFNAVEAALLARAGFTSSAEPLDGRRGLFALFAR